MSRGHLNMALYPFYELKSWTYETSGFWRVLISLKPPGKS